MQLKLVKIYHPLASALECWGDRRVEHHARVSGSALRFVLFLWSHPLRSIPGQNHFVPS